MFNLTKGDYMELKLCRYLLLNQEMIMKKRFIDHQSSFIYNLIYNKSKSNGTGTLVFVN